MKIAILSDTHGNVANFRKAVGWLVKEDIRTILHCGDIGSPESLKESLLDFKGDFLGVLGNMDKDYKILIEEYNKITDVKISEKILETKIKNPSINSGQVKKIAVTHYPEDAKELAETGKYDIVFYGHTHRPCLARRLVRRSFNEDGSLGEGGERKMECLLVNPGELAGQFYKPTFAVFNTDTDELELKILEKI